jgi:hypothetical protein
MSYCSDEASRLGCYRGNSRHGGAVYDKVLRNVIDGLPDMGRDKAEQVIVSVMQGMVKRAAPRALNASGMDANQRARKLSHCLEKR